MINKKNKGMLGMVTVSKLAYHPGHYVSYDLDPFNEGSKVYTLDGSFYYFDVNKSVQYRWGRDIYQVLTNKVWGSLYVSYMERYRHDIEWIKARINDYVKCPKFNHKLNRTTMRHFKRFTYSDDHIEKAGFSLEINSDNTEEATEIIHLRKLYTREHLKLMAYNRVLAKMES